MSNYRKFAALFDLHYGFETKGGHRRPLHDETALDATLQFLYDFKPDDVILGGDILDCGAISHHNRHKPRKTEGFRLLKDAEGCREAIIAPVEELTDSLTYIVGNHEDWLEDLMDADPALDGLVNLETILKLDAWNVIPQGKSTMLGKLCFVHGDQLKGGEHIAKAAVTAYEKSVRFGHFHTHQTFTKTSAVENKLPHTGVAVPCLCRKDPAYNEGSPNRWAQGFNWGYVFPNGTFSDYVTIITDGCFVANGKVYKG